MVDLFVLNPGYSLRRQLCLLPLMGDLDEVRGSMEDTQR